MIAGLARDQDPDDDDDDNGPCPQEKCQQHGCLRESPWGLTLIPLRLQRLKVWRRALTCFPLGGSGETGVSEHLHSYPYPIALLPFLSLSQGWR